MKSIPRDDDGHLMSDRGSELFTHRISDQGTEMSGVELPVDLKEVMFHVEIGTEILHVLGTIEGSTAARLTDGGFSWTVPLTANANQTLAYIAAPSGTCNVSIFAWR
jgi:hypothetical protein